MVLNYLWATFFLVAFVVSTAKLFFLGDTAVFPAMLQATFDMAKTGFEISLYLTGVMALWLGIMRIGEKGGSVQLLARLIAPLLSKIFPNIPPNHPAMGSIMMSFSANMLGLDNAATPLGLKAMKEMQSINPEKSIASNPQIMFLALNTSGMTFIPITIILDRSILGASNPADVFIPILICSSISSVVALLVTSMYQKINLFDKTLLAYIVAIFLLISASTYYFTTLPQEHLSSQSSVLSSFIILLIIVSFLVMGLRKKIPLYETFIEGAKEGFQVSIKIVPYLVAILVAIGVFRASGTLGYVISGISWLFASIGFNTDFVDALPVALMKPLSGSASRGMMIETIKEHGVDSFVGRTSSILRGSTETTFYILAVYFGSISIKNTRYAVTVGLIADFAGIIAGIIVAYLFFHNP